MFFVEPKCGYRFRHARIDEERMKEEKCGRENEKEVNGGGGGGGGDLAQ